MGKWAQLWGGISALGRTAHCTIEVTEILHVSLGRFAHVARALPYPAGTRLKHSLCRAGNAISKYAPNRVVKKMSLSHPQRLTWESTWAAKSNSYERQTPFEWKYLVTDSKGWRAGHGTLKPVVYSEISRRLQLWASGKHPASLTHKSECGLEDRH